MDTVPGFQPIDPNIENDTGVTPGTGKVFREYERLCVAMDIEHIAMTAPGMAPANRSEVVHSVFVEKELHEIAEHLRQAADKFEKIQRIGGAE